MIKPPPFVVAIVGRPNVGKSTLFNRLVGKRIAIVHDQPGVTRDRRKGNAYLLGLEFTVIDTAGLEEASGDNTEARMRHQTDVAVLEADVALLVVDARAGITPMDRHFAGLLRKQKTPVILVVNKCEGRAGEPGFHESYGLGLGDPVPISAEHGEGLGDLLDALLPYAPPISDEDDEEIEELEELTFDENGVAIDTRPLRPLTLAIVGRPNVGKSTLVNQLLGEERLLTGPEAGLTRDAITVEWTYKGREIKLVDTAGLRRKAQISDSLEKLSVGNTLESIRMSEVVMLVMDASMILDKQDLTIARMVVEEGRALVIAINKWDMVDDPQAALNRLSDRLETSLPQVKGLSSVTISAISGKNLDRLMDAVIQTHKIWNKRVSTAKINRWLEDALEQHPPPALDRGRRIRIRYGTQVKARPPTFVLFTSKPDQLPDSYTRYLVNSLRVAFDMPGVPIRIHLRAGKNPFADK
jgi:GTPase